MATPKTGESKRKPGRGIRTGGSKDKTKVKVPRPNRILSQSTSTKKAGKSSLTSSSLPPETRTIPIGFLLRQLLLQLLGVPRLLDEPIPNPNPGAECLVCSGSLEGRSYFPLCFDGGMIPANEYPDTGGPWIPAFTAAGDLIWLNGGGL